MGDGPFNRSARTTRTPIIKYVVLCCFAALYAVVLCTVGNWPLPAARQPAPPQSGSTDTHDGPMTETALRKSMEDMEVISSQRPAPFLQPWGEERLAVFREWTQVYSSIRDDVRQRGGRKGAEENTHSLPMQKKPPLQFLVYDASDGYMTLSFANFFPESFVTGVIVDRCPHARDQRGGCPSSAEVVRAIKSRWNSMQESNITWDNSHLFLCISPHTLPVRLGSMIGRYKMADYQVVLSLFDRLSYIPSKITFQRALSSVLKSATVATFITLPEFDGTMGRSQSSLHWYNQRQDPESLIEEAASLFSLQLSVTRLALIRHGNVNRVLFRVSVLPSEGVADHEIVECEIRRKLLRCDEQQELTNSPS